MVWNDLRQWFFFPLLLCKRVEVVYSRWGPLIFPRNNSLRMKWGEFSREFEFSCKKTFQIPSKDDDWLDHNSPWKFGSWEEEVILGFSFSPEPWKIENSSTFSWLYIRLHIHKSHSYIARARPTSKKSHCFPIWIEIPNHPLSHIWKILENGKNSSAKMLSK